MKRVLLPCILALATLAPAVSVLATAQAVPQSHSLCSRP
jgi:hypothetical protein